MIFKIQWHADAHTSHPKFSNILRNSDGADGSHWLSHRRAVQLILSIITTTRKHTSRISVTLVTPYDISPLPVSPLKIKKVKDTKLQTHTEVVINSNISWRGRMGLWIGLSWLRPMICSLFLLSRWWTTSMSTEGIFSASRRNVNSYWLLFIVSWLVGLS
jgi:hypothetical protein